MSAVILVSASASNINSLPLTSKVDGVTKAPDNFALVTVESLGVIVPSPLKVTPLDRDWETN